MTHDIPNAPGASRAHSPAEIARYHEMGWWADDSLSDHIARHAATRPEHVAFISGDTRFTWADYDQCARQLAAALLELQLPRGARVAIWLPDGPTVHVAFVAAELAGLVAVGVGARAGARELQHLLARTNANALITHGEHRGIDTAALRQRLASEGAAALRHHVVVPDYGQDRSGAVIIDGAEVPPSLPDPAAIRERRFHPDEFSMINSTSGTTGLPKCVMHNQNRWWYFHQRAVRAANLSPDDVFCSVVPAPFGFGLWTSHYTPAYLGAPCLVMPRFDAAELIARLAAERVTVLSCVSTQFIMMLASAALDDHDLSSL
ncbi:MAG TPA: class I adenylate-forming enzyme family protein, partial [Acidimicrobiales bacterium]